MATSIEKAFREDLAFAVDPVRFARAAYDIELDTFQREVLLSQSKRLCLCCCRQSGKSMVAGLLAAHTAIYNDDQLILLLSPSLRQSGELFRTKVLRVYNELRESLPVKATSITALSLTLSNGSRIVSLPDSEGTIRGYSGVNLLIADEAARISEDLFVAVRPMISVSRGRLVLLSTPWAMRGTFYKTWNEDNDWEKYKVTAYDCPRIPAAFLEEEKAALGPFFNAEYLCEWVDDTNAYFTHDEVMAAISDEVEPLFREDPLHSGATRPRSALL